MNESRLLYEVMHELGKHGLIFRTNSEYDISKEAMMLVSESIKSIVISKIKSHVYKKS